MNSNGSTLIEFLLVFCVIGTLLSIVFILLNEFTFKEKVENTVFEVVREMAYEANELCLVKISKVKFLERMRSIFGREDVSFLIKILENNKDLIKMHFSFQKDFPFRYTFKKEILFYR